MTGVQTFARALLPLWLLALHACGANAGYTSSESATSEGADSASSGGDAAGYGPQSYDAPDHDAHGAPEPAGAPAPRAPSGEMTVTGARISRSSAVNHLEVATLRSAKGKSAEEAPAPMPVTKGEPERDDADPKQHGLSLIYDARVHLGVFESQRTIDAAETLARDAGGYLVHRDQRRITVRVPAEKFQPTLSAVLLLGDVLHREVSVRDVTEEFRDLRIRLRNAEAVRDRLEQLLARADKVEQALAVERELERVAGEIEQIKGRLSMLQELIAFSTITVELRSRAIDHVESRVRLPFPWLDELGLSGLLSL